MFFNSLFKLLYFNVSLLGNNTVFNRISYIVIPVSVGKLLLIDHFIGLQCC